MPKLTPDKLDELKWIALATLVPAVRKVGRIVPHDVEFTIAIEVRESGGVMRLTLAESTGLPRMTIDLPPGGDIEIWPACAYCARVAAYRSANTGELACDTCAHNRQEFEPISVV